MKRKPLLMMRTRGISGPRMAHHHGVNRTGLPLSKSVGNFVGLGGAPVPPPIYNPNIVFSDGVNDRLGRSSDFIGNANGDKGIFSGIIRLDNDTSDVFIYGRSTTRGFYIRRRSSDDTVVIQGFDSSDTTLFFMRTNTSIDSVSGLVHILASWDTTLGLFHLYVNDISDITVGGVVNTGNIRYTDTNHNVGDLTMLGCMGDIYLNFAEYLDFSIVSNRRKFIDSSGNPISLGANGELPTGNPPIAFLDNGFNNFRINKGTGGDFSQTGGYTACV